MLCLFLSTISLISLSSSGQSTYTTSGLSSGGFFTVQLGVAYSSEITGIGIVAGGAYYCAQGSETTALTACMSVPAEENVNKLESDTTTFASQNKIDPVSNIAKQKVYLFSGESDTTVQTGVVTNAQKYFDHFGAQTKMDTSQRCAHGMVTNFYGNKCGSIASEPYIINCDYDLAGKILQYIYDNALNAPVAPNKVPYNNVIEIDQTKFIPKGSTATGISVYNKAYAYIATGCSINPMPDKCKLHIVFHGCEQCFTSSNGLQKYNDTYVRNSGYNQWAETNNMVILYPQANSKAVANPNGCWDWWGYNTGNYAFKDGKQMEMVHSMTGWVMGNGTNNNSNITTGCEWTNGNNKLNLTRFEGTTLSYKDVNNSDMVWALSPCDNLGSCDGKKVNSYLFNVSTMACMQYLSIWNDGQVKPQYDAQDKIWQFVYNNGEKCNGLQEELQVNWYCDPAQHDSAVIVSATKTGQCTYEISVNSSSACS
eukprot:45260_1